MISKIIYGSSFDGSVKYVCGNEGRAVVLAAEGVRKHSYFAMTQDFQAQQQFNPYKKKACLQIVISFYPGEKISDEKMVEIGMKYLNEAGVEHTQYAITKHTDTAHPHMHILANLVNYDGKVIKDNFIGRRGKIISLQLTKEYNLKSSGKKKRPSSKGYSNRKSEKARMKLYSLLQQVIPKCKNFEEFETRVNKKGISIIYKDIGSKGKRVGITFKINQYHFKGSQVNRKFSYSRIQQRMTNNSKEGNL